MRLRIFRPLDHTIWQNHTTLSYVWFGLRIQIFEHVMLTTIMIGNVNMLMFDFIANLIKICGNIRSLCLVYFLKKKKFTTSKCGTTGRWLLRFHHIPGSSSHEDCNCNFWKSQKPIEPRVCVGSEFSSSSSSLWYLWAYPTVPWGRGIITATRESPFSSLKKKKKKIWPLSLSRKLFSKMSMF